MLNQLIISAMEYAVNNVFQPDDGTIELIIKIIAYPFVFLYDVGIYIYEQTHWELMSADIIMPSAYKSLLIIFLFWLFTPILLVPYQLWLSYFRKMTDDLR